VLAFFSFQDVLKTTLDFLLYRFVNSFKKMSARELMKKQKRERAKEAPLPSWVKEGSYCIANDCLRSFLCLPECPVSRRFVFTLRIDSIHETLPVGVHLGQHEMHDRWIAERDPDRVNTGGVYVKCTPNRNFAIATLNRHWNDYYHEDEWGDDEHWFIQPLWLEPWMFSMTMHVGEAGCEFPEMVFFPRARGWSVPTFEPATANWSLSQIYESDNENIDNDYISTAQCDLDDDHPMRWVGAHRGMRYGSGWKTVRDYLAKKSIVDFWRRRGIQS
jgi:hypothetical protein